MSNYSTIFATVVTLFIVSILTTSITGFNCGDKYQEFQKAKANLPASDVPVLGAIIVGAFDIGTHVAILFNPFEGCGKGLQWISLILILPMLLLLVFTVLSFLPTVGGPG